MLCNHGDDTIFNPFQHGNHHLHTSESNDVMLWFSGLDNHLCCPHTFLIKHSTQIQASSFMHGKNADLGSAEFGVNIISILERSHLA